MSGAAAAAISSAAVATANAAKKTACVMGVNGYQHEVATVEQRQSYAECVRLLHPVDLDAGAALALKVAIVLVMLSTIGGAAYGMVKNEGAIFGGIGGMLGSVVALLLAFLSFMGLKFVFFG